MKRVTQASKKKNLDKHIHISYIHICLLFDLNSAYPMTQVANLSLFASCLHFILVAQKVQCTAIALSSLSAGNKEITSCP